MSPNPPRENTFPAGVAVLAPYWTDIDPSLDTSGAVFVDVYDLQSSSTGGIQETVSSTLRSHVQEYANVTNFSPSYVMVATWEQVAPYPANKTAGREVSKFSHLSCIVIDSVYSATLT